MCCKFTLRARSTERFSPVRMMVDQSCGCQARTCHRRQTRPQTATSDDVSNEKIRNRRSSVRRSNSDVLCVDVVDHFLPCNSNNCKNLEDGFKHLDGRYLAGSQQGFGGNLRVDWWRWGRRWSVSAGRRRQLRSRRLTWCPLLWWRCERRRRLSANEILGSLTQLAQLIKMSFKKEMNEMVTWVKESV